MIQTDNPRLELAFLDLDGGARKYGTHSNVSTSFVSRCVYALASLITHPILYDL
jgi:hypothetical protein